MSRSRLSPRSAVTSVRYSARGMAGSRLEKFGTVFTRVRDLIRSGVIKPSEKPVWYDVYRAFPPKKDPLYVKPHFRHSTRKQESVPEIFYREDAVRAKFYELYGPGPQPLNLSKSNFVSMCQRFVDKFTELKSHSDLSDSALFEETAKALLSEGVILRRRGAAPVAVVSAGSEEAEDHSTHSDTHTPSTSETPGPVDKM